MGGAAVCAGSGGRFAVLVGGRTSPMDALSDVWILDLDLGTWVRARPEVDPMTTAGAPLPVAVAAAGFLGRYRHSVVAVPPPPPAGSSTASTAGTERIPPGAALAGWRVVVFGGRNADVVLGDTWVLSRVGAAAGSDDLAAGWRWQLVAAAGAAPGPRKSHAACFVPGSQRGAAAAASHGSMYVHGGTCGYGMHVSEMYCLDLGSYVWHRVDGAGAGGGGGSGGGSPACFSHTLNRWGPYLLLVGGYPTDHHRQLWVFDTRTHVWTALDAKEAAPPTAAAAIAGAVEGSGAAVGGGAPSLDFLPVRHCAEVVSSDGTDGLYVMGGGAFCFSFGTVFGGCFRLPLAGLEQALAAAAATPLQRRPVQKAVAPKAPASTGTAAAAAAAAGAAGAAPTGRSPASSPAPSAKADTAGVANGNSGAGGAGGSSGGEGWVVCVPAAAAKGVKDALKAAGWLDASRRATVDAAAADADAAAAAAADGPGLSGDAATGPRVALVRLPVTNLAAAALGASADGSGGGGGGAAAEAARRAVAATGGQLERCTLAASSKQPASPGQRLRAAAEALLSAASPPPPPALSARLLASLPTRWERLGDLVLLPAGAFADPGWAQALGGSTEGAKGEGEEAVLVPLWRAVAAALGAERLARQAPVANTGTRDSRAQLLLGSHGWVAHREGGVTFKLDVTRCMFSSGNVTERTRMGWGRGEHLSGARLAAAAATAAAAIDTPGGTLSCAPAAGKAKGKAKADAAGAARGAGVEAGVAKEAAAAGPVEGCGGVAMWAAGETVVDLYTGIGYYTLPLLVVGGVDKVYACEWNPHALEALRRNLAQPGLGDRSGAPVGERCEVREGDCRTTAPQGVADRVLLGLLPSSRGGWEAAVRALKPEGGWLHLHHNVTDREEGAWAQACLGELEELARSAGRDWELRLAHLERVKWYAPHIRHVVLDIECRPRGSLTANRPQPPPTANGQALTAPVKAPPRPAQSQTAAAVGASGTGSAHATAALSPPAWCKQPLEQLQLVRRVRAEEVGDRAAFEASISAARLPVVIEGMDVGPAPRLWTPEHLLSLPDSHRSKVSLHVTRAPGGRLDFVHKNFAFRTMTLAEAVGRIARKTPAEVAAAAAAAGVDPDPSVAAAAEAGAWPELVPPGQEYGSCAEEALYLRSIGDNPRKEASNLSSAFPCLAPDVTIPALVPPGAMHSSVLRLSSPGLVLWTHYDVCDNFLIQVTGTKRVLLWPPSAHDPLHVEGSSSPVTDPCNPDLSRHPRFASCPPPLLVDLQPGDVLFLPSLWFHHVTATGGAMSISVNAFFRHLPAECYHRKDLYGNRDLVQAEEADRLGCEAVAALAALPPHYRGFYGARLLGSIQRELGL
ncbi:hypothetical protein HYH03_009502 [Edaphochlamys debaryana]|uniref:tRNA(Phe) (4-demethylwyosine(37)-C(7)) aminocarboxypropyltransferase n=1 Tax=Edaphochlamys debaryana TaxID=47281 RepID=A0A835XZ43_9CHLO|nr:hypothetical protein HYH03_009502 [Edaphochlamys debaryana]|eukprot:KAG2492262.1 hypothetical protein HYH03_009502 [Edaphochlamys debaryana]